MNNGWSLIIQAEALTRAAIEKALQGDATALRLCLERIVVPIHIKDAAVVIEQVGNTLTERSQTIVNTRLTGEISPSEATTLLQALATQARVIAVEELEARFKVLEEKLGVSK